MVIAEAQWAGLAIVGCAWLLMTCVVLMHYVAVRRGDVEQFRRQGRIHLYSHLRESDPERYKRCLKLELEIVLSFLLGVPALLVLGFAAAALSQWLR